MCGICGTTGAFDDSSVHRMNGLLRHRGPDDAGVFFDRESGVGIGARRLAIIDVSGGHQPLSNEDGTVWAVLNGEIYNHPTLRERLARRGHVLRTRTDTEVLVHLYEDYGDALVHAIEGMYAFAIWDRARHRFLLARDRFGEKPLFYCASGGNLLFASELTALSSGLDPMPDLDPRAVAAFCHLGYVPGPLSMLEHVWQVPPGHTLTWQAPRGDVSLARYWAPTLVPAGVGTSEDQAAQARHLLEASIRSRLVADVPVGVFLSGGVDSSLVTAMACRHTARVRTFSVGYDAGRRAADETAIARWTASRLSTEHHEVVLTSADAGARVPALLSALDQPLADPTLVATQALAEHARQHVKVVVGGDGADELFGGYPRYRWLSRAQRTERLLPESLGPGLAGVCARLSPGARSARLASLLTPMPFMSRNRLWVETARPGLIPGLAGPRLVAAASLDDFVAPPEAMDGAVARGDPAAAAMWLDQTTWLPDDILAKADRATMLMSLEMRTPFLERGLVEFANGVPSHVRIGCDGKRLLRSALRQVLPGAAPRRRKRAFRVPAADWLRGPLAPVLQHQLREGCAFSEGWLDRAGAARLVDEHLAGTGDRSGLLWSVLAFGLWLDRLRRPSHA
jgi:asparagine synthase (glutamine-hydrolysing)